MALQHGDAQYEMSTAIEPSAAAAAVGADADAADAAVDETSPVVSGVAAAPASAGGSLLSLLEWLDLDPGLDSSLGPSLGPGLGPGLDSSLGPGLDPELIRRAGPSPAAAATRAEGGGRPPAPGARQPHNPLDAGLPDASLECNETAGALEAARVRRARGSQHLGEVDL